MFQNKIYLDLGGFIIIMAQLFCLCILSEQVSLAAPFLAFFFSLRRKRKSMKGDEDVRVRTWKNGGKMTE